MIEADSPAKINRFLFITAKREDGYHELYTLFEKIDLKDRLCFRITRRPSGPGRSRLEIKGPSWFPEPGQNLIGKAALCFMEATGIALDIYVEVEKAIPAGGGLGGGSSNAATTLKCLNEFAGNPLSQGELMDLAARLGADVPFFLFPHRAAIGRGTGTELEPIQVEPRWYLLVLPDFSVSTAWAYSNFKLTRHGNKTIFEPRELKAGRIWYNDLEKPVFGRFPLIETIKERLMSCGAEAAVMSGSGSTVFGVFPTRQAALRGQHCIETLGMKTCVAGSLV
jgi:4-diphosphocytidyl-2-C-methyl-D-erythritol kinase